MTNWHLIYGLRAWQIEALENWGRERRGIVEVVTGGGKTVFAFAAMERLRQTCADLRVLIIVPSIALADQWVLSLIEELRVPASDIGLLASGEVPQDDQPIIVAVINSARKQAAEIAATGPTFLIVDECHRAGSAINAMAMQGEFYATLGLSATPDREYDEGFTDIIVPALGPVIFRYDYVAAARDGVITSFKLTNIEVPMVEPEEAEYKRLSRALARARRESAGADDDKVKRLLMRRAAVVNRAAYRVPATVKLLDLNRGIRAIVFHERVADAAKICAMLTARNHSATLYHAGIDANVRREHLRRFRSGIYDVLVCCRALDEGMNVPETALAVVASGTASRRQRIQRLGRILRPAYGKTHADVITLFCSSEEKKRLQTEAATLNGVADVRWQKLTVGGHDGAIAA